MLAQNRASSVKGRCAEILTRSMLACGCASLRLAVSPLTAPGLAPSLSRGRRIYGKAVQALCAVLRGGGLEAVKDRVTPWGSVA